MKPAPKGIRAWFRRFVLRNFWEGAVRWSPNRSFRYWESPKDARLDLTAADLETLINKCRDFAKNGPAVFVRLQGLFAQYTVGSDGIKIVPASSDLAFNAAVREAWDENCKNFEISGKSYAKASEEGANTLFCDGSYFIVKTTLEGPKVPGKPLNVPKIWLLERQRVGTPAEFKDREGKTFHNGIELDQTMRFPIAYYVREGDRFRRYAASEVEHVFDSTRPGQLEGVPIMAQGINLLHDLLDLQALQMKKAKAAADVANIIFNEAGEMTDEDALRQVVEVTTENSVGTSVTEERVKSFREAHGGAWSFLKNGEKMEQFKSESPSVTEQWHWRKTETDICAIAGSSVQLVFPESIQGTVQRGDIEIAAASYRGWSCLQGEHWGNVYLWWLEWAVQNDPRLKKRPADYQRYECRPPKGPNVDVGRNMKAEIEALHNKLLSYETIYAREQKDWRREIGQCLDEAAFIKEEATKRGLTFEEAQRIVDSDVASDSNVPPKADTDE